jgi:hypothetical protein
MNIFAVWVDIEGPSTEAELLFKTVQLFQLLSSTGQLERPSVYFQSNLPNALCDKVIGFRRIKERLQNFPFTSFDVHFEQVDRFLKQYTDSIRRDAEWDLKNI